MSDTQRRGGLDRRPLHNEDEGRMYLVMVSFNERRVDNMLTEASISPPVVQTCHIGKQKVKPFEG